jgi:hypothetical protein
VTARKPIVPRELREVPTLLRDLTEAPNGAADIVKEWL